MDKTDQNRRPLAYRNEEFLNRADARPLRILSEYLEPRSHFLDQRIRDTIVFFGSARIAEDGPLGRYYREAQQLAADLTRWSQSLEKTDRRFVICSGGGPSIMEAANRGAHDAGGKSIGLNISLPFEQAPNPYITPDLSFEFHYFFMRKFWFAYLAKACVVFPGGFGTLDEFMEMMTLVQTQKLAKKIVFVLYGPEFWKEVINFDALVKYGTISREDLDLFSYADDPQTAFRIVTEGLMKHHIEPEPEMPAIARTRYSREHL
ncbi:MAG: LOG family protein [Bryobacterales bacterium]|nr:LOG family protein [Bryobacterales bacterium]